MTTAHHTPIAVGAAANASVFNGPLGQLDASVDDAMSFGVNNNAELAAARSPYASLDERLDAITFGYVGGNIATLTNGAADADQKVVTVDSTTGFLAGAYVAYQLVGGTVEYNTIDTIDSPTQLTLTTNIGTGGIADNSYIGMISVSEYQAANAIPHDGTLTLPEAIQYANAGRFHVAAYGAAPGAAEAVNTAAIQAAIDDAIAAGGGTVQMDAGTYAINGALDLCDTSDVWLRGAAGHYGTILECHNTDGAAIECIGSNRLRFSDFKIVGHATDIPAVGMWFGRSTAVNGLNTHQYWLERVNVTGSFTKAAFLNVGAESIRWNGCEVYVENAACLAGIMFDHHNVVNLTPEHATLHAGTTATDVDATICWVDNSFITCAGAATSFSPFYIVAGSGPNVRNTYAVSYGAPIIKLIGGCYFQADNVLVEGTPTYVIYGSKHATYPNISYLDIKQVNAPGVDCSSDWDIWFGDDTTIESSLVYRCKFTKDVRLYNVQNTEFRQWSSFSSGPPTSTLTIDGIAYNNHFDIGYNDALDFNGSAYNSTFNLDTPVSTVGGYLLITHAKGLALGGLPGAAGQAKLTHTMIGTKAWDPGTVADGATAKTAITVTGVVYGDVAMVYIGDNSASGNLIAHGECVSGGYVWLSVLNKTGGNWAPGTITSKAVVFRAAATA